jgi:hypothetical protein
MTKPNPRLLTALFIVISQSGWWRSDSYLGCAVLAFLTTMLTGLVKNILDDEIGGGGANATIS